MTNTFISTNPDTKEQKTVNIPDGCILIEMQEKEISDFVMQITADFILNMGERDQIFPKEIKSSNGIWKYIYPIRRGVAGVLVNEEKWHKRIQGIKQAAKKKEEERLCIEDIAKMHIKYDEARIFYLASKGVLTSIAMDYLYPESKKEEDYGEDTLCEIILHNIVETIEINLPAARKELTKSRKQCQFFVYEFPISEEQKIAFLDHATHILCELVEQAPIRKNNSNYLEAFNNTKIDCYNLLKKIYRENDDDNNLLKHLKKSSLIST